MDEAKGKSSQIFCLTWVKRNAAKLVPDQVDLTPEEIQTIFKNEKFPEDEEDEWTDVDESDEEEEEEDQDDPEKDESDDELKEYDLDNYDEEEENVAGAVAGLVMFSNNNEDPYLKKKSKLEEEEDSECEDEEKSSINLKPDDNLLVCARCGRHSSDLEIYVYNHNTKDFYVHHDIPLSDTPLCMQWIGFDPGSTDDNKGNLLAVGNMSSVIDIWDLDILNTLEPVFSIGKKPSKKKKKKSDFEHTDAILDLAWTENIRDKLGSASADTTVALWDLELGKSTKIFQDHEDKVQTLEWKPDSIHYLLSGGFDGRVLNLDLRTSKKSSLWSLDGEIERVTWNIVDSNYFAASTDNGVVYYIDSRKPGSYLHKWCAHGTAIPGLVIRRNPVSEKSNHSLLYTASSDGSVKLWDLNDHEAKKVHERKMKMGMVHCCQGNPDETSVIAIGGQKDNVKLWDIMKTPAVLKYFGINTEDDGDCDDTIDPLGGGGENDDDVIKYLEGEDYINQTKLKKLEKETLKLKNEQLIEDGTDTINGEGKKKRKRRGKKKNAPENEVTVSEIAKISTPALENAQKKKKRRRKKRTSNVVENINGE